MGLGPVPPVRTGETPVPPRKVAASIPSADPAEKRLAEDELVRPAQRVADLGVRGDPHRLVDRRGDVFRGDGVAAG